MSRRGNCHDNAVAESFFSLLKGERIRRKIYKTRNVFLSNQIQGQYAFLDLPVSEDIVFGGEIIGSAYDQAELFGDHGLGARTRLNYQLTKPG